MPGAGFADGAVFVALLREGLVPQLRPGPTLLLANLKAHQVAGVAEAWAAAGVQRLSLPP
jgi:hypothetical protein